MIHERDVAREDADTHHTVTDHTHGEGCGRMRDQQLFEIQRVVEMVAAGDGKPAENRAMKTGTAT